MHLLDKFDLKFNVAISVYDSGKLVCVRKTHNVVTNTGRQWLSTLVGSDDYSLDPPSVHNTAKIKYVGFGCGGALQTAGGGFASGQPELVTVTALQDPVPISLDGAEATYLKQVDNQTVTSSVYFPGEFRTRFIVDLAESELSFAGNVAFTSGVVVGTSVPISEAGLYLSTAKPTFDPTADPVDPAQADPSGTNYMVAYNVFDPITITPNISLRVEWELRF